MKYIVCSKWIHKKRRETRHESVQASSWNSFEQISSFSVKKGGWISALVYIQVSSTNILNTANEINKCLVKNKIADMVKYHTYPCSRITAAVYIFTLVSATNDHNVAYKELVK